MGPQCGTESGILTVMHCMAWLWTKAWGPEPATFPDALASDSSGIVGRNHSVSVLALTVLVRFGAGMAF